MAAQGRRRVAGGAVRKQRALGSGRLVATRRGGGPVIWRLDYRDASGARRRENLGTDKRVAERRQGELIRQRDLALGGLASVDGQNRLLAEIRDAYLRDLRHRATASHVSNVTSRLTRVLKALPAKRVRDVRPHDVLRMREGVLRRGCGNTIANMYVGSLSAMLNWSAATGLIHENPIKSLKRLPENESTKRHKRRALSEEEIVRLLDAAEADDRHWAQWHSDRYPQAPLFRFLLETGARYGEATSLTWGDVDLDRAVAVLRAENTKSRKSRAIPLRREMVEVLRSLPRGERVFLTPESAPWCRPTNNLSRILKRMLKRAGIARVDANGRKIDVHGLRHCAASRMARAGAGLVLVQRILGHASPRLTSQIYSHVEVEDLRTAVELISRPNTTESSVA